MLSGSHSYYCLGTKWQKIAIPHRKFHAPPTYVWVLQSRVSHAVENWQFYAYTLYCLHDSSIDTLPTCFDSNIIHENLLPQH